MFENNQSITVHGGLTGLVGGTVSEPNDIVISLERLNQIEELDTLNRTVTTQAGVVLEEIHKVVEEEGFSFV